MQVSVPFFLYLHTIDIEKHGVLYLSLKEASSKTKWSRNAVYPLSVMNAHTIG